MGKRKHHPCSVMPYGFLDFFENAKKAQHFVIRAVGKQLSDFLVRHGVCAGCICPQNPVGCHIERLCNADECGQPRRFLPSSMLERCTTEISAFSASSPCVSPTSRRKSQCACRWRRDCSFYSLLFTPSPVTQTETVPPGLPTGIQSPFFFICLTAIYSFVVIRAIVRTSFVSTHNTTKAA